MSWTEIVEALKDTRPSPIRSTGAMNILGTSFSLATSSLDIYLAGCTGPHCSRCHNPESWNFQAGTSWIEKKADIIDKIDSFPGMIQNIFVMGGEPLDQPREELREFLFFLQCTGIPVWLFTRRNPIQVPEFLLMYCDYVKCGRYDDAQLTEENIQYGVKLASANQQIFKKGVDY